jgi:acetyltransferase-like isoleucine patch superfamily enzyme
MLGDIYRKFKDRIIKIGVSLLRPFVINILFQEIRVWGDKKRLHIAPTASMANTLFNTASGKITVGASTFTGHNVSILTGRHDYNMFLDDRRLRWPTSGGDIVIGSGVWIGSNATLIGPCKVGDHAVIAAGSVVISDVGRGTIVAGVPAKPIKQISSTPS